MKSDKTLLELEAELRAIEEEKKAMGVPDDLRYANLEGFSKEQLKAVQELLQRQVACIQKIQTYLNGLQKGE